MNKHDTDEQPRIVTVEPATLARSDVAVSAKLSEADLDRAVHEIKEISATTAAAYWAVGRKLIEVHERQLWKLRSAKGARVSPYTSFDQWAFAELRIKKDRAHEMMKVAKSFSCDQVREFGRSKLELVTRMPKELHDGLLEEIRAGASHRELKAKVVEHKAATGFVRGDDSPATKATQTHAATKARVKKKATTKTARTSERSDVAPRAREKVASVVMPTTPTSMPLIRKTDDKRIYAIKLHDCVLRVGVQGSGGKQRVEFHIALEKAP